MPRSPHKELDSLTLSSELTLISIIQGVALYFLVENARSPLVELQFRIWPYIFTSLVMLILFFSRTMIHALTVIRWPVEFGHNFLYIAATLLEAVAFTQIGKPASWFFCNAGLSLMVWLLFLCDLKLVRGSSNATPAGLELEERVHREQMQNIRMLMPMTLAFNALAGLAILHWPDIFVGKGGDIYLVLSQLIAASIYLAHSLRFYRNIVPLLTQDRSENL